MLSFFQDKRQTQLSNLGLTIPWHRHKLHPNSCPACKHHIDAQHAFLPTQSKHDWSNQLILLLHGQTEEVERQTEATKAFAKRLESLNR